MIEPSLQLNFAKTRQLDRRISFSRADTADNQASYYDANGILRFVRKGEPRFTHDPSTGSSLGLLIEEARTNLFTYSEDFRNTADAGETRPWSYARATLSANATTAPDGTTTADKLVEDITASNSHYIYKTVTVAANQTWSISFYMKAAGRTLCLVRGIDGSYTNGFRTEFDLTNLTATPRAVYGSGANTQQSIVAVDNGWVRVSASGTLDAISTSLVVTVYIIASANATTYTGDGTSGLYIWGAQLEQASTPSSYIPTAASTVTRIADSAVMTGANFSSWVNAAEGTILAYYDGIGWLHNNTPPTTSLDIKKQIDDYTTAFDGAIRHLLFYPRELTAAERTAITSSLP